MLHYLHMLLHYMFNICLTYRSR